MRADLQKMMKEGATLIYTGLAVVGSVRFAVGIVEFVDLKTKGKFGKYYTAAQVEAWAEDVRRRNETLARSAGEWAEELVDGGMCSFLEDKVKKCMDRQHHDGSTTTPVPSPCQVKVMFLVESLKMAGMLSTTTSTTT